MKTSTHVMNRRLHPLKLMFLITMIFLGSYFLPYRYQCASYDAGTRAIVSGIANANVTVAADGTVTFGAGSSNVTKIMISHVSDFAGVDWQNFDADKFKAIGATREALYVRFMTATGVMSDTVVYTPGLEEGDIVKTADNPDVYIIKYKNGKQYKRVILSPSVFNSYGHLKWSNLKIGTTEQLEAYVTSNLVQVAGDHALYVLVPNGDEGEKTILDTSKDYDIDSVYEINSVDRDSYRAASSTCSGSSTQRCSIVHGTGSQTRICSGSNWSEWGICVPASCEEGYQILSSTCVSLSDAIKPVVTAFSLPSTSSSKKVSISSFIASDNVGVTGYVLTESASMPSLSSFSSTKPTSYTFSSSGTKTLYAWVKDAAGNISLSLHDGVNISLSYGGGSGGSSGSSSTCSGASSQACSITNGTGSQTRTCTSGSWSDWGTCAVTSCNSGYQISGNTCDVIPDTTKPIMSAFVIPDTATSLIVTVSTFTATDNVGVTGYALTENSTAPALSAFSSTKPTSYTFATAGAKTLYAWARDAAGNISSALNDSVTITLPDTTIPIVSAFTIPATATSLTLSISTFTATDNVGVTGYALTENSTAPALSVFSSTKPTSYTFATAGTKTLYAWARDAAGNISSALNDSVTITLPDTTAPVISSIASSVTSTTAIITWTTDESATSVVDYGASTSYGTSSSSATYVTSHTVALTGLTAASTYHYRISSADASSNTSTSTDRTFTTSAASSYISGAMSSSAKVIFLHHSTGGVIWNGGVSSTISAYNTSNSKSYSVTQTEFPKASPYGWNNYPYDYWNIWVNHAGSSAYMEEPTLEILTQTYDVIVWKHCFPVSSLVADTGSPNVASSSKSVENYKLQYAALKAKMHEFPNKRFIVWTGAALVQGATNSASATWARDFATWVKNTWDEPGDNIFVWDFRELETDGGLYLLPEHAASTSDSHPNATFAAEVAPIFANRIIDVIEGRG